MIIHRVAEYQHMTIKMKKEIQKRNSQTIMKMKRENENH